MIERAYAKLNLCLDVIRRREDGYHDLRMVMVPISFYDVLTAEKAEKTSLTINRSYIPVNEKNTVIKAIRLMQERYGITDEFECVLKKQIPTQAGLAGGSADAAAVIRMIDRMEGLHLSREELISLGRDVGADVPFCIFNEPCLAEGIGEILTPIEWHPDFRFLLVKPRAGVSTAAAFKALDFDHIVHPDCTRMAEALRTNDYEEIIASLGNSLEQVSLDMVREIREIREDLAYFGFDGVLMSGSGSTVFGITKSERLVRETGQIMRSKGYFTRAAEPLVRRRNA